MATQTLAAFLNGTLVGFFTRQDGKYSFEFDEDWSANSRRQQLSLCLPKSQKKHEGEHVGNFLQGLLPDNTETLNRWAARFDVRVGNPLALLEHVGLDCAGALQFTSTAELGIGKTLERDGGVDEVSTSDIAKHLRALNGDSNDWVLPANHGGQFSLGGAQSKFAVVKTGDGWGVPWGDSATTHIFKPGVVGLMEQNVIEHLTMASAAKLGLNVANTSIETFEGIPALIVERYDRRVTGGAVERIHQEDFCQALGVHPSIKYENEGGPGIASSMELLGDAMPAGPAKPRSTGQLLTGS